VRGVGSNFIISALKSPCSKANLAARRLSNLSCELGGEVVAVIACGIGGGGGGGGTNPAKLNLSALACSLLAARRDPPAHASPATI